MREGQDTGKKEQLKILVVALSFIESLQAGITCEPGWGRVPGGLYGKQRAEGVQGWTDGI